MGDDKPTQKAPTEQPKEKAPDKSVDALQIAGDLARQELEFKQETEAKIAGQGYQKDKAAVQADLASKRAEILVSAAGEAGVNYTPGEAPVDQSLAAMTPAEQAEMEAISAQAVEAKPNSSPDKPTNAVSSNPSANPTSSNPEPPKTAAPEKSFGEKIKEFFTNFIAKIMAFFTGKKVDEAKPDESPKPTPNDQPVPANADSVAQQPSNPESLKGPDSTAGLKGKALFDNPQFQARTDQIAANIGVGRADLYAIFKMESGGDPHIQSPISHATGLIQWMPRYMPQGVTPDLLKSMTGLQQLDYVEKHFARYKNKLHSFSDLYRAVFFPAAIGKGPDYIFGAPDMAYARKVADQNSGIARDVNGYITNASFERHCAKHRPSNSAVPLAVA